MVLKMVFYKYVSSERIDILQNRLIRFTQPNAMNDPFEAKPHFYALGTKEKFAETCRTTSESTMTSATRGGSIVKMSPRAAKAYL